MTWAKLAVALIAPYEGCHDLRGGLVYPYLDKLAKPPVWTQGYGITYGGICETTPPITKDQAMRDFEQGIKQYGLRCASLAPILLQHPNKLAAVTSWAWNCGCNSFKVSRLRKAINEQRWEDAATLILKPDTAGGVVYRGLVKRRAAEAALFRSGLG